MDLSSVLAIVPALGGTGLGVAAVCWLIVSLKRLRLARHFGDRALVLSGKRAEHAHELAREALHGIKQPRLPAGPKGSS